MYGAAQTLPWGAPRGPQLRCLQLSPEPLRPGAERQQEVGPAAPASPGHRPAHCLIRPCFPEDSRLANPGRLSSAS